MTTAQRTASATAGGSASVAAAIRRAWDADRSLDATGLRVAVNPGGDLITLDGDVGCATDRVTAQKLTASVAPAFAIRNRVAVRPCRWNATDTDARIASLVRIAVDAVPDSGDVWVAVSDHVVTLAGEVPDQAARIACHAAAARTSGVHFVVDRLRSVEQPGGPGLGHASSEPSPLPRFV